VAISEYIQTHAYQGYRLFATEQEAREFFAAFSGPEHGIVECVFVPELGKWRVAQYVWLLYPLVAGV
jgi:hypothetical protein